MKLFIRLFSILFFLIISIACSNAQKGKNESRPAVENKNFELLLSKMIKEEVPLISVDELHKKVDSFLLLDAREINEYKISHIEGAKYIGYDVLDYKAIENISKDTPIVIYCSIGVRSEQIGSQLNELGFTNVQNLYGSIFEWANKGYNLVDNAGYPTKKVHGYSWLWGKWMIDEDYEKVY
jgi:rhodanese-related sulfurtransferase